jgi:hypothetical protein
LSKIPDVVDGEPIESAWGNQSIRDRTVQRMDTVADRDASIPAPGDGETVWIQDIDELQTYTGTRWVGFLQLVGGAMSGDIIMLGGEIPFRDSTGSATNRWSLRRTPTNFQIVNIQTGNPQLDFNQDGHFKIVGPATHVWIESYLAGGTYPALRLPPVYDIENPNAANVVVTADGTLARSTAATATRTAFDALEARVTALENA